MPAATRSSSAPGAWVTSKGLMFYFGYCPHPVTVYIRVLVRAIYNHIILIIQLLLRGGSTEVLLLREPDESSKIIFLI